MKPKKRITLTELANVSGWSRKTVIAYLRNYREEELGKYDPHDINSVFDFYDYLVKRRNDKINALRDIKKSESRTKKELEGISFVGSLFRGKAKAHVG